MDRNVNEKFLAFEGKAHDICYAFYRYEIKSGLNHLESMVSQLTTSLIQQSTSEEQLVQINQLLELVMKSVENRDFLIAADLIKYELLERIRQLPSSSA